MVLKQFRNNEIDHKLIKLHYLVGTYYVNTLFLSKNNNNETKERKLSMGGTKGKRPCRRR